MRALVFGKTGQVATELARILPDARFLSRQDVELSDTDSVHSAILNVQPNYVLNAAAWTDVDGAEDNVEAATAINGAAPGAMAKACAELSIPLVHISTDYVFDGQGSAPWEPNDKTNPIGAYGVSKLAGENAIAQTGCDFAILRTSWVFSAHGKNFVKTMLRLSEDRDHRTIVADQVGGPTSARAIADACVTIARSLMKSGEYSGIYHFSGKPDVSWAEFARAVFEVAGKEVAVEDIPSTAFPTRARRPLNSRMDCSATESVFGIERPNWRADLVDVITELEALK